MNPKPKSEINKVPEVRAISNFFKPKQKTESENSPSKSKEEIRNPMLRGLQIYQTEARKL